MVKKKHGRGQEEVLLLLDSIEVRSKNADHLPHEARRPETNRRIFLSLVGIKKEKENNDSTV